MEHTLKSFDVALNGLLTDTVDMSNIVQKMIRDAGEALLVADGHMAREVVERDLDVDRRFDDLRARCLDILTRYHPIAGDLRQVMAVEHSVGNLERAADHAKSIAKRAMFDMHTDQLVQVSAPFRRLCSAVADAVGNATRALFLRDPALARLTIQADREIDAIHDDLFHLVLSIPQTGGHLKPSVHLLFAAKSLERIGDHATNISEEAMFMAQGSMLSATRDE